MNERFRRSRWWTQSRFGMFIHWGLYAIPARNEWIQSIEQIHPEKYERYKDYFNPDQFDPKAWAKLAAQAGMKYFVITAKHHDGFCMWDTHHTDYKADRDFIGETIEAFRAEGLRAGLYYSLLDWHHPDFVIDVNHPLRNISDRAELNARRDQKKYAQYMRDQVTELLSNYGKIDIIWFDYSYPRAEGDGKGRRDWESEKLIELARRLQPDILIDDRLDLPGAGDFRSPEQYVPENGIRDDKGELVLWEGCQTFSGSWGYFRDEFTWKTPKQVIQMLVNHVSRGGNLLMNVGPDARGKLDCRTVNVMKAVAAWMDDHRNAIYNCTVAPAEMPEPENCRYTYNPETNRLYLHVMSWPVRFLHLEGMAGKVKFARLVNDNSEILIQKPSVPHGNMTAKTEEGTLTLLLPSVPPPVELPVIELFL